MDDSTPVIIKSRQREVVMIPREEWESWMETMHQLDTSTYVRHVDHFRDLTKMIETGNGERVRLSALDCESHTPFIIQ